MIDKNILVLIPACWVLGILAGIIIGIFGFGTFEYNVLFCSIGGVTIGFVIVIACCTGEVIK